VKTKIIFLLITIFFLISAVGQLISDQQTIAFFSVGEGDASHIRLKNGFDIVIDGGPDQTFLSQLSQKMPFFDRTIELVILTHPDYDHLTGLNFLAERYQVDQILVSSAKSKSYAAVFWQEIVEAKAIPVTEVKAGDSILTGDKKLEILWPPAGYSSDKINNQSIVFSLTLDGVNFLFSGDIEVPVEEKLNGQSNLRADVLKVAHHGSNSSSTISFLSQIAPKYAIISVGQDNKFGHPNPEVLNRLREVKSEILRTDQLGAITFVYQDGQFQIETENIK